MEITAAAAAAAAADTLDALEEFLNNATTLILGRGMLRI
jgi:hypothetical protein